MSNSIEKRKNLFKKKLMIVGVAYMMCLSACGTNKEVETEAEKIVEAVESKDMKILEAIIFGTRDLSADEELAEFFVDSETEGSGIISKIVEQDSPVC